MRLHIRGFVVICEFSNSPNFGVNRPVELFMEGIWGVNRPLCFDT
jgi:hypothetical protein